MERTNPNNGTIRFPLWRKCVIPLAVLGLMGLSAGCAMHRGDQSLGERIAQATVRGGAQPEMAIAPKLPNWSTPVSVAAQQAPASTPILAANPPATQVAVLTPSQPVVVAAPAPIPSAIAPIPTVAPPSDRGVAVLAMPPSTALPLPEPDARHLPPAEAQAEAPAQTPTMSPEHAATEAAALTAAIPLPDPLPMPFVNRAAPLIGPGDAAKPRAASAQHSSAATTHAASAPRIAAVAPAAEAVAPTAETPMRSQPAPEKVAPVKKVAARAAAGHGTRKVATGRAGSRHARTVASRHSRSRHVDKVATRRGGTHAAQKRVAQKRVAQKHAARKNVVARRSTVRPARTATSKKRDLVDHLADRDGNRPKPVATSDKARAVVTPAEVGGGTPSQGGWVGPLAPGATSKIGVTHSSALERPRTGFALASAAERLKSGATAGRTRASPRDRAKTAAARASAQRHGADGRGTSVRLADSR